MTQALDSFIVRLRSLRVLPREVAKEAAPLVEKAIKKQVASGLDPTGKPWKPKKDGGKPLEHAADAISTKAVGETIVTTLEGKEVYHHHGVPGGAPQRRILPDAGELPPYVAEAVDEGASRAYRRLMGAQ